MSVTFKPAIRQCEICGSDFTPPKKNRPGRYCSAKCRNTGNARASAKKRGESQRGKGVVGYVKQGGRHQHRIVAEQMLGRLLVKGEIVHHKDGNKHNNSPENLEVMKQGEHMRAHGMGIPGKKLEHKPWEARWSK
jgi:hypothetical protein